MTTTHPPVDLATDLAVGVPQDLSPREIADLLLPEDRARFHTEYALALEHARSSLDLGALTTLLEQWYGLAVLQEDPEDFARFVRDAAGLIDGEAIPAHEPLSVTRARVGL